MVKRTRYKQQINILELKTYRDLWTYREERKM